MQIHLYIDDLHYEYIGKPEDATMNDFPVVLNIELTPIDSIIFHWGDSMKILLSPYEEI